MSENVFDKALISDEEWSKVLISRLSSRPNAQTAHGSGGYDAKAMKAAFDAQGNLLKERHNTLVNYARAEEGARAEAETARVSAEEDRKRAEALRVVGENDRIKNENDRIKNENDRIKNENDRVAKDAERDGKIAKIEALVGDVNTALDSIIALQESFIGGGA